MFTSTGSKVAGASAIVAIPSATAVGIYKDEIFGLSKEEDTYWKFFYFAFRYEGSGNNKDISSWKELKSRCRNWKANPDDNKSFLDGVRDGAGDDVCLVTTAFSKKRNDEWGRYLGYFNKFNTDEWRNREINYSDSATDDPNQYRKLFSELDNDCKEITDDSLAKPDNWHPSRL